MHNTFTFISIDPGTTYVGFSIWVVNSETLEIVSIDTHTFHPKVKDIELEHLVGTRFAKLLLIEAHFKNLLETYKPISVACESPFYFSKRPGAFAPLVESLFILKRTVFNYDWFTPFITYDPSSIKNSVGAKGFSDKKTIKDSMTLLTKLPITNEFIESKDEHSIDSIAVGYCHYERYILNNLKKS